MYSNLYVYADQKKFNMDAINLAKHLEVLVIDNLDNIGKEDLYLKFSKEGLSLNSGKLSLLADFASMISRVKDEMYLHELLVKASKFKNNIDKPKAIDATAGFGEDSLLLAAAGFNVTMYEYNPVISALLKDALRRAKKNQILKPMVERMKLIEGNSIEALPKIDEDIDIVYLDPMFPERQKKALIKKKFQLIQRLESPCMDEENLLKAAMKLNPKRIVIKRPAKGPFIAGVKPDYSIQGKSIRYDCIASK